MSYCIKYDGAIIKKKKYSGFTVAGAAMILLIAVLIRFAYPQAAVMLRNIIFTEQAVAVYSQFAEHGGAPADLAEVGRL